MRAIKYGTLFLLVTIFMTGCGSKTLICTIDEEGLGNSKVTFNFNSSDEITDLGMYLEMDFGVEIPEEDKDSLCDEYVEEGYEDALNCKVEVDGTNLTLDLKYDFTKISDDMKEELTDGNSGYDDVLKQFEDEGYTCE